MLVCRRGQSLEFVDVTIAFRTPRRHTASLFQPAGHTLQLKHSRAIIGRVSISVERFRPDSKPDRGD